MSICRNALLHVLRRCVSANTLHNLSQDLNCSFQIELIILHKVSTITLTCVGRRFKAHLVIPEKFEGYTFIEWPELMYGENILPQCNLPPPPMWYVFVKNRSKIFVFRKKVHFYLQKRENLRKKKKE